MKVILVNGSPHEHGCTDTALKEIEKSLHAGGVETEIFWLGKKPVSGCIACGSCRKTGKCFLDDVVNEFVLKAAEADGFIFGSPVHYASPGGTIKAFMDRVFYSGGKYLRHKPAAAVVSSRRAGGTATLDVLNKYFTINCMPVVSSNYWNEVHGGNADEVRRDEEGMQIMRVLGSNMVWLLKCIEAGRQAGIVPTEEKKIYTNFIR